MHSTTSVHTRAPDGPLALSLGGGGSKGSWEVGALDYLIHDAGLRDWRVVYGTSTGALIAAKFGAWLATGDDGHWQALVRAYREARTTDVIESNWLLLRLAGNLDPLPSLLTSMLQGRSSIFSGRPLVELVDALMPREAWEAMIAAGQRETDPVEIGFCVTDLQTGDSFIVSTAQPDVTPLELRKALLASAFNPVFMPTVRLGDRRWCLDGGLRDVNPIRWIFRSAALAPPSPVRTVVALSTDAASPGTAEGFGTPLDVLSRAVHLLNQNTFEANLDTAMLWNTLARVRRLMERADPALWDELLGNMPPAWRSRVQRETAHREPVRILTIHPDVPLGGHHLQFDPHVADEWIRAGRAAAQAALGGDQSPVRATG